MPRTKSDTVESLGIETFLNERYSSQGGYEKFMEMLTAGETDSAIARAFSTSKRTINYQTISNWRRAQIERKTREA